MQSIRMVLQWLVWPVYLTLFLGAFAISRMLGYDPGLSILTITIVHIAIIALTELVMPVRLDWTWRDDRQVFNDLAHSILLEAGSRLGAAVLVVVIAMFAATLSTGAAKAPWPLDRPFWMQLAGAILIYDLFDYWKHRAYHSWAWLWQVHLLHHNPPRMHVFKAGRLHFLEATIRAAFSSAPLVLLGAPAEVFFWLAALANAFGGQNHWNVDARLPRWLHWTLATPQVHWLHHGKQFDTESVNLSPFTMLFDHLFGTYRDPGGYPVADVGVSVDPLPKHIPGQLAGPLLGLFRSPSSADE